jgi:signal transduction histidine kinase/ActR/RegA family two-component response regulator
MKRKPSNQADARLEEILEVLLAIARQDFKVRAPVGPKLDVVDAISTGINALAEELDGAVSSKQELQTAYDALKLAQSQLVQAGKLAAIGQLSSGVAHEINNPATWATLSLAVVERELRGLREELAVDGRSSAAMESRLDAIDVALEDAREGIQRISLVAGDLRAFARADDEVREALDLNEIVRISTRIATPAYRLKAKLLCELGDVPRVLGKRGRLGQVVANLLVNAAQALEEADPQRHVIRIATVASSSGVSLIVEDSGPGIAPELRERVFEPFYTTKPPHQGTGLGLSLVREIIHDHGGEIEVGASGYGGARIEIRMPRSAEEGLERVAEEGVERSVSLGKPRVLVVDDELLLLRALKNYLKSQADVVLAEGGEQALSALAEDPHFDLVLCDLNMPGIDGPGVYEVVKGSHPELLDRFVFLTGGALTPRARKFLDHVQPRLVHKPVGADALLSLLNAAQAAS